MAALMTALTRWALRTDGAPLADAIHRALDILEAPGAGSST